MGEVRLKPAWAFVLFIPVILSACDSQEDEFVADCMAGGGSRAACECYYEFGKDGLNDEHMKLYAAVASGNDARISKAQSDLGLVGTGVAMAKIGWVVANAESACAGR